MTTRAFDWFFSSTSAEAFGSLDRLMLFLIVDHLTAMKTNTDRLPFILMQLVSLALLPIVASMLLIIILKLFFLENRKKNEGTIRYSYMYLNLHPVR